MVFNLGVMKNVCLLQTPPVQGQLTDFHSLTYVSQALPPIFAASITPWKYSCIQRPGWP
jgi:hypothetical protein